jgi:metallo-beta-lactamase family protein
MIQIEFIGAARSVTGSKHLIRTSKAAVLLDCGLFQGRRKEAYEKNINLPIDPSSLTAIVLSHSHIDHSGALPSIYRKGYRGPIYSTHATRDLCTPMLIDAAWIMKADSDHIDKLIAEGARNLDSMPPIYSEADVVGALRLFIGLPYHVKHPVAPGIDVTFIDAGHILGSAITILYIKEDGRSVRLAFTGDLGRKHLPLLRDPEVPSGVTHLISESTYGDRLHDPIEAMGAALRDVIVRTVARGGKVIIPSFALERAQEIIFSLKNLLRDGRIPKVPVYVDSPLTVKITDIFKLHPECLDQDSYKMLHGENNIFDFDGLTYISSVEDSKRISESRNRPS